MLTIGSATPNRASLSRRPARFSNFSTASPNSTFFSVLTERGLHGMPEMFLGFSAPHLVSIGPR